MEMVVKCCSFHLALTCTHRHHTHTKSNTKLHWRKQSAAIFTFLKEIFFLFARWEEEKYEDGVKWKFLEHKGPYFPPEYQPLPDDVHFYYEG